MNTWLVVATLLLLWRKTLGSDPAGSSRWLQKRREQKRMNIIKGGAITLTSSSDSPTTYVTEDVPLGLSLSHVMPVSDCLASLSVDSSYGLTSVDVQVRRNKYGYNELAKPVSKSLLGLFLEQFDDKLVQILLGVACLSSVLAATENDSHAFAEPLVILSIIIINGIVGVLQSKSASDSLESLRHLQPESSCALRDGVWSGNIPSRELVPGDIIYVRVGDKIPADCRILQLKTTSFNTDEGSLTGESVTVSKDIEPLSDPTASIPGKTNMIFSGTLVTTGGCIAVVVATGETTEIGKINKNIIKAKEAQKLDEFGDSLTKIIGGICLLVFIASIPRFDSPVFSSRLKGAIYYAKVAVALGVAAIPEGLPMVITLCLSLGTKRMAKKNVIVRKLQSVETLGCTSVICTDKTGTLTTNQMTAKALITFLSNSVNSHDEFIINESVIDGISYEPIGAIHGLDKSNIVVDSTLGILATICSLCNEAYIEYKDGHYHRVGEPTEAALKVLVEKLGVTTPLSSTNSQPWNKCDRYWSEQYTKLATLEFTRDRKSMSVLVARNPHQNRLLVKGAAELVINTVVPITDSMRSTLSQKLKDLESRPLRCLAVAYVDPPSSSELQSIVDDKSATTCPLLKNSTTFIELEQDMILVGITGIKDPARPEAAAAITKCKEAGVRIMMMTGDSKETAISIAKDVNIFTVNDDTIEQLNGYANSAFTGKEFFALPLNRQIELLKHGNKVFCRTEPSDKQRLITMLEKLGEVIAMTGDGVNDAPALQQADIGIAMGITGTEVSKDVADMILSDDNFASIVAAIEEGRNIYSNMQAFVCFLISCNIGEIATMFISTVLGLPEPLTPLHLLWVNLVTDGPPATALGFNPSDPDAMKKLPRLKSESILSKWLCVRYIITGLYVGCSTVGAYIWWYMNKGITLNELMNWTVTTSTHARDTFTKSNHIPQSMALSTLVAIEMMKALSAVSLDNSLFKIPFWKNKWLLLGVTIPCLMHGAVMYTPVLANVFGLAPLTTIEWKIVLKFAVPILFLEEILKFTGRNIEKNAEFSKKQRIIGSEIGGGSVI